MNFAQNQYELGPDGTVRPMEETALPLLRHALRVRRNGGASLLRVR